MVRRSFRSRRRRSSQLLDISLTPLVDTALTLLVIFMITTPMIQNAIRVSLPKGKAKEDAAAQQELVVYVDKDKKLFFNGTEYSNDSIISELKQQVGADQNKLVYVKADQGVPYGTVLELIDRIKVVGGVSHVVLATQKYT
ncbi:MAG TPA: biopolymer transporter ExbD [Candidatus Babeliales bacterium]|nr:biopolymer transporter ExbD [Candidatus Babeliales bacterium]